MAERKSFLLRLDPELHRAMQRWADDELRSLNGQIEFVLRKALGDAGRKSAAGSDSRMRSDSVDEPGPEAEGTENSR